MRNSFAANIDVVQKDPRETWRLVNDNSRKASGVAIFKKNSP